MTRLSEREPILDQAQLRAEANDVDADVAVGRIPAVYRKTLVAQVGVRAERELAQLLL